MDCGDNSRKVSGGATEQAVEAAAFTEEGTFRSSRRKADRVIITFLCLAWAVFQLSLPKFLMLDSITVRAIHLSFALALVFLTLPFFRRPHKKRFGLEIKRTMDRIPTVDYVLAVLAAGAALYLVIDWEGIAMRSGIPAGRDIAVGVALTVLLLEAARRAIGVALTLISVLFTLYVFFGACMPSPFALRPVSVSKYVSQIALSAEGIYGIPLYVSASTVFLFVLLGSMLERIGAGHFFNDLALSLLGRFKGGAAKASIVSSGLTGMVSGSSIANVVTTGTFTIPLMKKVGYPGRIAAATEVAASTNGQLMPPIMGAAAFIIAVQVGIPYIDVIKAAAIPAFVSYIALFYITHLEASKRGMKGLAGADIPRFLTVLKGGFYYLIPLGALIYELVVVRHTPNLAAFNAIVILMVLTVAREVVRAARNPGEEGVGFVRAVKLIGEGMVAGSKNMLSVALATAAAGIVVGIVAMGLGSMIVQIVETLSGGNFFVLLFITAVASLLLGMGLPTTATYIVMASITVQVIVKLGADSGGFEIPVIAAHLFCFYFGILADDTPPVGLAAYAASAIAKSDPIRTGVQGFIYDLRTALIPFMFIFNPELLLHGVDGIGRAVMIFAAATVGACAFANAVQGWFLARNRWYEIPVLLAVSLIMFHPAGPGGLLGLEYAHRYLMYPVGVALYAAVFSSQRIRLRRLRS